MRRVIARVGIVVLAVALVLAFVGARSQVAALSTQQTLRTSGEPFGIAIDAAGVRAYVTDTQANTLYVFDLASGTAVAWIPTGRQPGQVVLSGTHAYVSNFADASITVVDTATNSALKTLPVGGLGLAVDPATHRLYAAGGSRVFVLDVLTETVVATISAPAGANLWGVAVDSISGRVYVTDIASPRVLVYDGVSTAKVAEIAIDAPARFGITTGSVGRLFVASYTDRSPQLSIIDGPTATVVARVGIGAFTMSIAQQPSSGLVYALSAKDRVVSAVDPSARAVRSTSAVAESPGGLAVHPTTGALLVVTTGGTPPPPTPTPKPVTPFPAGKP